MGGGGGGLLPLPELQQCPYKVKEGPWLPTPLSEPPSPPGALHTSSI